MKLERQIYIESPVQIPDFVVALFKKYTTQKLSFHKTAFYKEYNTNNEAVSWFTWLRNYFNEDITPEIVYFSSIKKGLSTYVPYRCRQCGSLLKPKAINDGRTACSMSCARMSAEVQEKRKANFLKNYGVTSHFHLKSVQDKMKATWMKKYGVTNPGKAKEVRDKIKKNLKNKYGVENAFLIDSIRHKLIYNIRKTQHKKYQDIFLKMLKSSNVELISPISDYIACQPIILHCNHCGTTWIRNSDGEAAHIRVCPNCSKNIGSFAQRRIVDYISSIYSGFVFENNRKVIKPYELDIYIPAKKLAFEFNGTYWHSENRGAESNKHILKTKLCNQKGIRLIHIFEYEAIYSKEKIEALIRASLGIFSYKIFARKCEVRPIEFKDYFEFLEMYHLQGSVKSSIRYGLFYNNELVSVIGFGKSRFKKDEIELHRYCVKSDYNIIGGFSKLIKHACRDRQIKEFISYIDLAHFTGKGYKKVGFEKIGVTRPSYVYVNGETILSRQQCQKHKLAKLLGDKYNPDLSETQNMISNGYYKLYDSGTLKVKYTYKE